MTTPIDLGCPPNISDGDFRRASALWRWWTANNPEGAGAIILEAEREDRVRALIWCLCGVITGMADDWDSATTTAIFAAFTRHFAERELTD